MAIPFFSDCYWAGVDPNFNGIDSTEPAPPTLHPWRPRGAWLLQHKALLTTGVQLAPGAPGRKNM